MRMRATLVPANRMRLQTWWSLAMEEYDVNIDREALGGWYFQKTHPRLNGSHTRSVLGYGKKYLATQSAPSGIREPHMWLSCCGSNQAQIGIVIVVKENTRLARYPPWLGARLQSPLRCHGPTKERWNTGGSLRNPNPRALG